MPEGARRIPFEPASGTPRQIRFIADRGDARLRLDQVLVRRVTEVSRMSRSQAQAWIESGAVLVNGRPVLRPSNRVPEGAAIEIELPDSASLREEPRPEALPLTIVYEDPHLLALDKPAGVIVHPTYKHLHGTLLNAVMWHIRDSPGAAPGIVSRLDRDTSGLLLVALSPQVHAALQRQSAAGRMRKEYLAVVRGTPPERAGVIDAPLGRDPSDRRRVVVMPGGAASTTRYEVLGSANGLSLLRCELITGRTHQIRVHLSWRGFPLLGDALYGIAHDGITRQALHSWRLTFVHGTGGMTLTATPPVDFQSLLDAAGLTSWQP